MTLLDSLATDHRALETLLTDLAATASHEPDQRVDIFSRLQTLLQAHSRAEEEVLYRRLKRLKPDEEKTLEAFEEHHIADVLLQELASACPGGPGWAAKVRVFEELLRHHIKEEETVLFPVVLATFETADLELMDREFRVLKHERLESMLAPFRRATPAFAGRAMIYAQAAAGRLIRRGELAVRRVLSRLPA